MARFVSWITTLQQSISLSGDRNYFREKMAGLLTPTSPAMGFILNNYLDLAFFLAAPNTCSNFASKSLVSASNCR
jgi:hypothetical protein